MVANRPPIWKIIKDCLVDLGGKSTVHHLIERVNEKYCDVKENTLRCQITICTVNSPSRVHYPENSKPRSNFDERYDTLFSPSKGQLILYDPKVHGQWQIGEVDGKTVVVRNDGEPCFTRQTNHTRQFAPTDDSVYGVYCPVCKKAVKINDERAGKCPLCGNKISELFEAELRDFLSIAWKTSLQSSPVQIGEMKKAFDYVSSNHDIIGDAKFYKALDVPAAKWSTIAEYVWLLQFTKASHKFLVFGRDRSVPERWLSRHRSLLKDVQFYFYDHKNKVLKKI